MDWHADSVKRQVRVSNSRITGSFIIHMRKRSACNARDVRTRDISFGRVHARPREIDGHAATLLSRGWARTTRASFHVQLSEPPILYTLVSVRLPDCEITLFKFLNAASNFQLVSYSRKIGEKLFCQHSGKIPEFLFLRHSSQLLPSVL